MSQSQEFTGNQPKSSSFSSFPAPTPTPKSPDPPTPNSSSASLPGSSATSNPKAKSVNIFSNDGTFLERFKQSKMEEQDKEKAKLDLERRINFEDRFKNRRKRRQPPPEDEDPTSAINPSPPRTSDPGSGASTTPDGPPTEKACSESSMDQYQRALKEYESSKGGLSDFGNGVRSLAK